MPTSFDFEELRERFACDVYLETGLYDPREDVSCRKALGCGFKKLYSIELRQDWVEPAHKEYDTEIESGRLTIIHDDSVRLKFHLERNADFANKTFFFLDAHVDNILIKNYTKRCPIFDELSAIKELTRDDNVICVDDMRIMRTPHLWQ